MIFVKNALLALLSGIIGIVAVEGLLTLKSKLLYDYDTEMWRYSRELKTLAENPKIGHLHVPGITANLQGVEINLNRRGMRGKDSDLEKLSGAERKVMILGSSISLGWGVDEKDTLNRKIEELAKKEGANWVVLNAGIGNYNTLRYTENYFENLLDLKIDTLIVQYFINDAEVLETNTGNFITRNFHLGVLGWKYLQTLKDDIQLENLTEYYQRIYASKGFDIVHSQLSKLKANCDKRQIRCLLAFTPDIHQTKPYPLWFINKKMEQLTADLNLEYVDMTPDLIKFETNELWNPYNDPHPNKLGHAIMAKILYEKIK